jgi:ubiquinone/menaquinone biosynthesis C-methylase UbiE
MAERVGETGGIVCVDVQPQMLNALRRRLLRKGLTARVELRQCTATELGVTDFAGSIDLAVLIHVLHEVSDPRRVLRDIVATLRPNGKLLFAEPKGHVSSFAFQEELTMARELGLVSCDMSVYPALRGRQVALLERVAT